MIMNKIVNWAKNLPYWQQHVTNEILKGNILNDKELDMVYKIFKQENNLIEETLLKVNFEFPINLTISIDKSSIKWNEISNVKGVNALKSDVSLEIGKQLTLIYGENGSGKSGYTRMLNNVFVSRGDKAILPNIFSEKKQNPSAKFLFENGESLEEVSFPDYIGHNFFKRIAVFDTVSAMHDLTKESELSFSPIEFGFFDNLIYYTEQIKLRFEKELTSMRMENKFGPYFDKNTSIKKIMLSLDGSIDVNELKKEIEITEDIKSEYKKKIERKTELQALKIEVQLSEYNKIILNLQDIEKKVEVLNTKFSQARIDKTKGLLIERDRLEHLSSKEGVLQFESDDIENIESKEWKEFILAAKKYYETIETNTHHCIFCKQDLNGVIIIEKYWKYLQSKSENDLNTANENINKINADFANLYIELFVKGSKFEEWLQENEINLLNNLINAEKEFGKMQNNITSSLQTYEWDEGLEEYSVDLSIFTSAFELLKNLKSKLDSEKVKVELKSIQQFEDEYTDKLKVEKLLPDIEKYIGNNHWADLAMKSSISTRAVTSYQNKLFSEYVTSEYINNFDIECKKLKVDFSAETKQRGSRGTTLNRLTVKGNKPVEILSEGEQRSIALANFFAETRMNKENICIIFDDPVSSLDYKRRDVIVRRLVEEAKEKQVVVFTHDITFLLALQNMSGEQQVDCSSTTIRKITTDTGIPQNNLPWIGMPVKKRISYLKNKLQENIEKKYKDIQPKYPEAILIYEESAKLWCEQLRETWERIIEEILFNDSVQRYSPAIQTQRLKTATFTIKLYDEVELGMSNCSKWVHDRAGGLGEEVPEPSELREYLSNCEAFVKKNRP